MRPNMKDLLMNTAGRTVTENGAVTNATTGNDVLNLFALGGAVRGREINEVVNLIDAAWKENEELALKVIFYLGDVRQGQGERDFFFNALRYIASKNLSIAEKIMRLIPEYSRWDMLFAFVGTKAESYAFKVMHEQFVHDLVSDTPSLLAKWLPSPGTKSQKNLAVKVARAFGIELGAYRKVRASLNRKINTVEVKMSAKQWDKIELEKVPAKAFMTYQKAFERHGRETMEKFVEKIETGEVVVKSKTLFPYEIVEKSLYTEKGSSEVITLQSAWDNLPNYIGEGREGIAVIDTSASMTWGYDSSISPMVVAKSMGMYLSERLSGPYKDHYITFSEKPIMAKFHGSNLKEKYNNMKSIVANTNIESVFDLILEIAVKNRVEQSDIPAYVYIFSDMEFDQAVHRRELNNLNSTLFEKIRARYVAEGYQMPQVVFWNLNARNDQYPVTKHETGTALVSGFSPSTFKYITKGVTLTPFELMLRVINAPRYEILSEIFDR